MKFNNFFFIALSILTLNSLQYQIQAAAGAGTVVNPSTRNQQNALNLFGDAFSFLDFKNPKMARTAGGSTSLDTSVLFHEGSIEQVKAYQAHLTKNPLKVIKYLNERGGQLALLKSQNQNYPIPTLKFPETITDQELVDAINTMNDTCKELITSVNLTYCNQITDFSPLASLTNLQSLNLSGCTNITDAAITALAQSCPNLQSLNLYKCSNITDAAIIALAKSCKNLHSLNLTYCHNITDAAITALAQSCPNLQSLNLSDCRQITDAAITALAQSCPNLQDLNLTDCTNITDAAVTALAQSCKDLQALDLIRCSNITDAAITAFYKQRILLGLPQGIIFK